MIGFGNSETYLFTNNRIELLFGSLEASYFTFSMPTDGIITALSASFTLWSVPQEGINNNIIAELYYSLTPNNIFVPVPGAKVNLGTIATDDSLGTVYNGIVTGINVPIPAQTALLFVFYNTTTPNVSAQVTGAMRGDLSYIFVNSLHFFIFTFFNPKCRDTPLYLPSIGSKSIYIIPSPIVF